MTDKKTSDLLKLKIALPVSTVANDDGGMDLHIGAKTTWFFLIVAVFAIGIWFKLNADIKIATNLATQAGVENQTIERITNLEHRSEKIEHGLTDLNAEISQLHDTLARIEANQLKASPPP
jgi:uncharacterized protein YlxW (UPF0749 family)